ncbi:MAG TPA: glycosyltransferase, partial [Chthoniobacterales bacterium]
SDDLLAPGALQFVGSFFARNPTVDVVYGHRILINEGGAEIGRWILPPHCRETLRRIDYIPQETLFWRADLYHRVGGLDPSFTFAMDWDLILRFLSAGAVFRRLPYFLACFRVHDLQKTSALTESIGITEVNRLRRRELGEDQDAWGVAEYDNRVKNRAFVTELALKWGVRSTFI